MAEAHHAAIKTDADRRQRKQDLARFKAFGVRPPLPPRRSSLSSDEEKGEGHKAAAAALKVSLKP
jgi:hypothetical protein